MQKRNRISSYLKESILCIMLLQPVLAYCGGDVKVKGRKFILVPFASGIWQKTPYGELDIGHPFVHYINHTIGEKSWHKGGSHGVGYLLTYAKLGAEFNFNLKHEIWAPKVSGDFIYKYFCICGSVEDYLEQGKSNFYLIPEAGFTFSGFISLTGGYNLPFSKSEMQILPTYRIALKLLLPFTISGKNKKQK